MANLKEIRNRISSVSSTMQITSAMKMVSAAKLKRAQDAITRLRPYASKLRYILENVSGTLDMSENAFAEDRGSNNVLIVAITSNRGLCGGFNSNIIKKVNSLIKEDFSDSSVSVVCLGKKIKDVIKKTEYYYSKTVSRKRPEATPGKGASPEATDPTGEAGGVPPAAGTTYTPGSRVYAVPRTPSPPMRRNTSCRPSGEKRGST